MYTTMYMLSQKRRENTDRSNYDQRYNRFHYQLHDVNNAFV